VRKVTENETCAAEMWRRSGLGTSSTSNRQAQAVTEHPGGRRRVLWGRLPRLEDSSHCLVQQRDAPLPLLRGCVATSTRHGDDSVRTESKPRC